MKNKRQIFVAFLLTFAFAGVCQQLELTDEEKERFREITVITVNQFQDYLGQIGNANGNKTSEFRRRSLIGTALEDFINKGEPPADCEGGECGPVLMLVSSLHKTKIDTFAIRDYLFKISRSSVYDSISITRAQSCYVSQFKKSGTDLNGNPIYEGVATFFQDFCGYSEGRARYCDRTVKDMRVQLRVNSDNYWRVLLGDTEVKETKPLSAP